MTELKTFLCTDFKGFWPVGTAGVIRCETEDDAVEILSAKLMAEGLEQKIDKSQMREMTSSCEILCDGNY